MTNTPDIEKRPTHTANGQPIIYLTFDDGPDADTAAVLSTLAEHGAKATFFVVGGMVQKHPQLLKAEAEAGPTSAITLSRIHIWKACPTRIFCAS